MPESSETRRNQPRQKFDQDVWKFSVQVAFSGIVLGLCIFQLVSKPSNDPNTALYWGGLSSVLAYWLPAPGQNRDNREPTNITQRTFAATDDNNSNGQSLAQLTQTTVSKGTNS